MAQLAEHAARSDAEAMPALLAGFGTQRGARETHARERDALPANSPVPQEKYATQAPARGR